MEKNTKENRFFFQLFKTLQTCFIISEFDLFSTAKDEHACSSSHLTISGESGVINQEPRLVPKMPDCPQP